MYLLLTIPFLIQAIVIGLDEYLFHLKRWLPRWERIGHPLDTLSVLLCLAFILIVPYSSGSLKGYLALSLFSCLFVTKDEFIHKQHCLASEQWLHSILFINHPVLLTAAGLMWPFLHGAEAPHWLTRWLSEPQFFKGFLLFQAVFGVIFMCYQVIYWNFIWKQKRNDQ